MQTPLLEWRLPPARTGPNMGHHKNKGECVMKRPADRRAVLVAAGAAALVAATGTVVAQSINVRGAVTFKDGVAIPEGNIEIYIEDLAIRDRAQRRVAETHVTSDGGSKMIDFSFDRPASATASPTLQIVARLERPDGWLVARGSAQLDATSPVNVTLTEVSY
jgi:uncharacterized lipoprotein YbaY